MGKNVLSNRKQNPVLGTWSGRNSYISRRKRNKNWKATFTCSNFPFFLSTLLSLHGTFLSLHDTFYWNIWVLCLCIVLFIWKWKKLDCIMLIVLEMVCFIHRLISNFACRENFNAALKRNIGGEISVKILCC